MLFVLLLIHNQSFAQFLFIMLKGQIISKRFFLVEDSSKKRTKTLRILVKTNSFVLFWKNPRLDNLLSKLTDLFK